MATFSKAKEQAAESSEWVQCAWCEQMKHETVGRGVVLKGGIRKWACFICLKEPNGKVGNRDEKG